MEPHPSSGSLPPARYNGIILLNEKLLPFYATRFVYLRTGSGIGYLASILLVGIDWCGEGLDSNTDPSARHLAHFSRRCRMRQFRRERRTDTWRTDCDYRPSADYLPFWFGTLRGDVADAPARCIHFCFQIIRFLKSCWNQRGERASAAQLRLIVPRETSLQNHHFGRSAVLQNLHGKGKNTHPKAQLSPTR